MNTVRLWPFLTAAVVLFAATASQAGTGINCNVSITTSGGTFSMPSVYEAFGVANAPIIYDNGINIGSATGHGNSSQMSVGNTTTAIMFNVPPSSQYGIPVYGEGIYVIQNGYYMPALSSVETCNSYSF